MLLALAGGAPGDVGDVAAGAVERGASRFLLVGDDCGCAPGDQGIAGREFVMLLSDIVFLGGDGLESGSLGLTLVPFSSGS